MSSQAPNNVGYIRILVDEDTLRRLMKLADICHADPKSVAASLLHDILKEDEDSHALEMMPTLGSA